MTSCKFFYVTGRVQGVWYRASTQQQAQSLGLSGHARNLPDGRVEILACGPIDQLDALEAWLWQGPPNAQVADVESEEVEQQAPDSFTTV